MEGSFLLGMVMIYRLGSYVVLPGVNIDALNAATSANQAGGIVGLINMFAGGAFLREGARGDAGSETVRVDGSLEITGRRRARFV